MRGTALRTQRAPNHAQPTRRRPPRVHRERPKQPVRAATAVATTSWAYILGVLVDAPTLRVGGNDPLRTRQGASGGANLGTGGLFPDVAGAPRRDGLVVRMHDNAVPSGIAFFVLSAGFSPVAVPIPGFSGRIYADLATLVSLGTVGMGAGAAEMTLAPPNTIPVVFNRASLVFQGGVLDLTTLRGAFSNAQRTQF